jgi:hypothetical protein
MNLLPLEIVHRILEYDGRIKYRHGKYMNQIAQDDDRYKMLQSMPRIYAYKDMALWRLLEIQLHKDIRIIKYDSYYVGEEPLFSTSNFLDYHSSIFTQHGIRYEWIIKIPRKHNPFFLGDLFDDG